MYKIEVLKKIDRKRIDQWKELWKKAENANIYNSYEWFQACIETNTVKEYEVYLCYENEQLSALLPLHAYRCFGVKVLGSFDKDHLVDTPFLMKNYDSKLFKHFFNNIMQNKNIYLQKVDNKSAIMLHKVFPDLFFSLISVNPVVDIKGDPFMHMSNSTKAQVKKIIKRNEATLSFKTYTSQLEEHLETIFKLQNKSSKKARSMDIFENENIKLYYRNLIKYCKQFVCINLLYFENKPIAYEIGCMYKKHYAGDQISYHNDYKKLSPGRLIMFFLLSSLKNKEINELDMGGGISSYKMSVAGDYRLLYNVYYSPNSAVMIWWKLINRVRRMKQILFPKKFTRDHEFLFKTLS